MHLAKGAYTPAAAAPAAGGRCSTRRAAATRKTMGPWAARHKQVHVIASMVRRSPQTGKALRDEAAPLSHPKVSTPNPYRVPLHFTSRKASPPPSPATLLANRATHKAIALIMGGG
jgi:hypothetical protein